MMWCVIQLVYMMMALGVCVLDVMDLSVDHGVWLEIWGVAGDSSRTAPPLQ